MFGFPIGNGNAGFNDFVEKFTNNADSGFPKIQQREVFYSVKDGNWNDITVWQTTSGRIGIFPTSIDDVYIRHTIVANTATTINNLFVSGVLSVTVGVALTFNNIRCYGSLINNGGSFRIQGNQNYIEKSLYQFISGDIQYIGNNQEILDLNYGNLYLNNAGTKYLARDLFVNNAFQNNSPSTLELYGYNITINGSTTFNGTVNATGSGNYLFVGLASFNTSTGINLVGNPTMEFRGGIGFGSGTYTNNLGSGDINITTNNQSITSATNGLFFNNAIKIASGITLTFPSNTTTTLNSTINGLGALSKLVNSGGSNLVFTTQNGCENLMSTGIYDFTTSANTINFGGNYSATIPSYFTTFHNLTISGTGTKTLGVNTTLNGNLAFGTSGYIECSTYNLTVTGTTALASGNSTFSKNGSGSLLFIGQISGGNPCNISLTGNPSVEIRGGTSLGSGTGGTFNFGTTTWTATTNNQTIAFGPTMLIDKLMISGAITITNNIGSALVTTNGVDGNNSSSSFINKGDFRIMGTSPIVMDTLGIWDFTTFSNNVSFGGTNTYTIPSKLDFYSLTILSGLGVKTMSKNLTILGNFNNGSNFECSTYNLTVNGTSSLSTGIQTGQGVGFGKNSAGSLIFIGLVTTSGNNNITLTGNPTIEFRGGATIGSGGSGTQNFGNGTITLSTNNQTLNFVGGYNISNSILISGAIDVTYLGTGLNSLSTINGNNANSKLLMGASSTLNYKASTQPMATGILDTSTNLNTWIYGLNNQDIKGGPTTLAKQVYRNLTLNGTGVKTLQGYVSVQNTYTLTAPATLALNGYTLTNP